MRFFTKKDGAYVNMKTEWGLKDKVDTTIESVYMGDLQRLPYEIRHRNRFKKEKTTFHTGGTGQLRISNPGDLLKKEIEVSRKERFQLSDYMTEIGSEVGKIYCNTNDTFFTRYDKWIRDLRPNEIGGKPWSREFIVNKCPNSKHGQLAPTPVLFAILGAGLVLVVLMALLNFFVKLIAANLKRPKPDVQFEELTNNESGLDDETNPLDVSEDSDEDAEENSFRIN